jgi:hypothetical protein
VFRYVSIVQLITVTYDARLTRHSMLKCLCVCAAYPSTRISKRTSCTSALARNAGARTTSAAYMIYPVPQKQATTIYL